MADTSSSDESAAPAQRRRRSARLSADRGVISRAAYAAPSESGSGSETEGDATRDDASDDDLPLAQREEADGSDEETEDERIAVKQEPLSGGEVGIKTESTEEDEQGDASSSDDESEQDQQDSDDDDDDDAISIKSEQEEEQAVAASDQDSDDESVNEESEGTESDVEEVKSEEDDEAVPIVNAPNAADEPSSDETVEEEHEDRTIVVVQDKPADAEVDEDEEIAEQEEGVDEEEEEEEQDEEELGERRSVSRGEVDAAKQLLDHVAHIHLSFTEQAALHKKRVLTGPPVDYAVSQADQWKRKYRWPVAIRNVRRRKFVANTDELAADYQVQLVEPTSSVSETARSAFAAALAPTARPLMQAAVATFREQSETRQRDMNFVDHLEETKEADLDAVDVTRLRALTRLGGHFTEQLLDSILVKNVLALQGVDASYAQQCWDPLPTSKRPVANWRFVLEHFCRTLMHGVEAGVINSAPRLRKDTLVRIRDRLRVLYGVAWRPEDDVFFNLVDQQEIDPPEPSELIRL